MKKLKKLTDLEGRGNLRHRSQVVKVSYRITVQQQTHTSRTFGGTDSDRGLKDLAGWVEVLGQRGIDTFDIQDAMLELDDGRKIDILLQATLKPERELSFTLRDALDFFN